MGVVTEPGNAALAERLEAFAILRLELAGAMVEFRASPATEPVYTVNPFEERGLATLFLTHPRPEARVRRLRDLDPDWREKLRAA